MRAAVCVKAGGPGVLEIRELPVPAVRDGWSLVRVKGAGLNRSELRTRQGLLAAAILSAHWSAVVDYDRRVSLKRWAEGRGVSSATARRWLESRELPVPAHRAGRLILVGDTESTGTAGVTAVRARVSPARKPALTGRWSG